jgi:regulator of sigma E protease
MEGLIMAAQIILSLSILVGIHEAGHMFTAKFFGMRVEQFSIGFPPKIFGFKKGETEYSIGSIPLGGFVKITGMVDESLDTEKLKEEPKPYEFRAKPAWQRLIVMLGGIVMNVIVGIAIFVALLYINGEPFIPRESIMEHGIIAYNMGEEIGLQTGDKIINVNGMEYREFSEVVGLDVLLERNSYYTILRGGETMRIDIPDNLIERFADRENRGAFISPRLLTRIGGFAETSPARDAGMQKGDVITTINSDTIYAHQVTETIKSNANQQVEIGVQRPNVEGLLFVNVTVGADSLIGIRMEPNFAFRHFTFGQSIVRGSGRAFEAVYSNARALGKVITGQIDPRKSLAGPIGIAQVFGGTWDWQNFWYLTGLISMILAFMNLLPIPALDGGHVMFLLYEMVSGHKPSDSFMEVAQKVGMVILLGLMVFVIFNDIWRLIF